MSALCFLLLLVVFFFIKFLWFLWIFINILCNIQGLFKIKDKLKSKWYVHYIQGNCLCASSANLVKNGIGIFIWIELNQYFKAQNAHLLNPVYLCVDYDFFWSKYWNWYWFCCEKFEWPSLYMNDFTSKGRLENTLKMSNTNFQILQYFAHIHRLDHDL